MKGKESALKIPLSFNKINQFQRYTHESWSVDKGSDLKNSYA
jgi:hypothetical protein